MDEHADCITIGGVRVSAINVSLQNLWVLLTNILGSNYYLYLMLVNTYTLVSEVVQVGELDSRLVEEDAFKHGIILGLFLLEAVVNVDFPDLGFTVDFGARALFGILVWRGLFSFVVIGLIKVAETGGLVLIMGVLLVVGFTVGCVHLGWMQ